MSRDKAPTRDEIRAFRGIFKTRRGEKPATQQLLEDRAEDLRLEKAEPENHRGG